MIVFSLDGKQLGAQLKFGEPFYLTTVGECAGKVRLNFFCLYVLHMDLYSQLVCQATRLSCTVEHFTLDIHTNFLTKLYHTCHTLRPHWLVTYFITSSDLDLTLWSQGQYKAKPVASICWHSFQLISMKYDAALKQFKMNCLILLSNFNELYWVEGNNCCFTECQQNFINVSMHSDVYKLICLKIGLMIDTMELYILMLAFVTWLCIKVTGVWGIKNVCPTYLTKC